MAINPEWDVVVVGGANTDYLARGTALPTPGTTADGDTFLEAPGGKGANQAVAAARLGARVALIARLGVDRRGDDLHAALTAEGVDLTYIIRDDRRRLLERGVRAVAVEAGGARHNGDRGAGGVATSRSAALLDRETTSSRPEPASTAQEATEGLVTEIENVTPGVGPSEPGTFRRDPE